MRKTRAGLPQDLRTPNQVAGPVASAGGTPQPLPPAAHIEPMDDYSSILVSIAVADWVSLITPGPNFVFVTAAAMRRSRLYGLAAGFGIVTGSLLWCLIVLLGLDEAFRIVPWLSPALRVAGSLYLIYLGVLLWRGASRAGDGRPQAAAQRSGLGAYAHGILISLTNPAAVAYYAGIFSSLLQPDDPTWVLVAAISMICLSSVLWNAALAVLFSTQRVQEAYRGWAGPISRVAGVVMLAFGLRIAFSAA